MIGRATAPLAGAPRRWLQRLWGYTDIHTRQKWTVVWPYLARLPRQPLRLLDAGCGDGLWSLELAARRPHWSITGVDRAAAGIQAAEAARLRLNLRNVVFVQGDLFDFPEPVPFDVVLSVASAHYAVEEGRGVDLFRAFRALLQPNGILLLFAPRCRAEVPYSPHLPAPFKLRDVVSAQTLQSLCDAAGLTAVRIVPAIGALGTVAKQIDHAVAGRAMLSLMTYPLQLALSELDRVGRRRDARAPSAGWIVQARRPPSPDRNQ